MRFRVVPLPDPPRSDTLAPTEFDKRVKAPQQDQQLRTRLQQAQYLEPGNASSSPMGAVSPAFDPPVMLIREDSGRGGTLMRSTG